MAMFSFSTDAQNLVPNPSFECGEDFCGPYQPDQTKNFKRYACDWTVPGTGTSDVFSTKIENIYCFSRMPAFGENYHVGSQLPRTGKRFAGIYTYSKFASSDTTSYREYIQVKLNKPLKSGEKYCSEMYVSATEHNRYFANNFGMRFNVNETFVSDFKYLNMQPQVLEKRIMSDTTKWTKVAGIFEATEPSNYLIIGNFFGDGSTQARLSRSFNQQFSLGYYFIKDVSVEKMPYDKFTMAGSTVLRQGQSRELSATAGVDEITWTTALEILILCSCVYLHSP